MSETLIDKERKHLEGLLKDRINFYLVFSSIFLLGAYRTDPSIEKVLILFVGTIVSFLLLFAVIRTHRLVQCALNEICEDNDHPYKKYKDKVKFPGNANLILVFIPIILSILFSCLTVIEFLKTFCQCITE